MSKAKILIVEDELVIALSIEKILEKLGYEVIGLVTAGEEAVVQALDQNPDLILMDIILSGAIDGIEAARRIRKSVDIPIIYITANADSATLDRARDTLPYGYLNKPINERDLLANLDSTIYKHRMERRIHESEEKYRNLVESINDIIMSFDENGTVTYISPQTYEITGYRADEVVGNNIVHYLHPDDREKIIHVMEKSRTGVKEAGVYRVIAKTGTTLWMRVSGRPGFVEGRFVGVRAILSDITKQKEAEETANKHEAARLLAEDEIRRKNDELTAANEELQAIIEELEATNQEFEEQNRELKRTQADLAHREALLQSIFRAAPTGIGIVYNRVIDWANKMLCDMTGYTEEELKGRSARMLYPTDEDYEYVGREKYARIAKRGTGSVETRWRRKDGTVMDVLLSSTPLNVNNLDAGVVFTALDITEKKRIGEALAETAEKHRLLADNIPYNMFVIDIRTLKYVYTSPAITKILGYEVNEVFDLSIDDVIVPSDLERLKKEIDEEIARDGQPGVDPNRVRIIELEEIHKNGSIVDIEITAKFLRDKTGKINGILGISRDITEHKKALQALKESEEKYRLVANNIPHNLWIIDLKTLKYVYTSPYTINALGYSDREMLNLNIKQTMTPRAFEFVTKTIAEELAREGKPGVDPNRVKTFELEQLHKNGSVVWTEVSAKFVRDKTGKITGIQGISRDITGRKREQIALEESEKKFRMIIEDSPIPISIMEKTGAITYINKATTDIHGYTLDDFSTMTEWENLVYPDPVIRKKMHEDWERAFRNWDHGEGFKTYELDIHCKNGSQKRIDFQITPLGDQTVVIMNDLTERKIQQEMLIQTEKMMSLGAMAAGMAHEINNPLGIILQGIQGALSRLEPTIKKNRETAIRLGTDLDVILSYLKEREILEYLNGIQDAGLRAAKIITNMLQFSRRSETSIAPVDINLLVDKTIEMAANDYDLRKRYDFKTIQIIREYDPELPMVPCSEIGIEQVVLNLLKNSSQAMAAVRSKGFKPTIIVKTGMEDQFACITLSDNGPGIEKNIQGRIFEPFYTTKESGIGTGLGLSVSNHIITKIHHGRISVESELGKGATFTIKLPIKRST
jgi:PAS domain S-box-containing protein